MIRFTHTAFASLASLNTLLIQMRIRNSLLDLTKQGLAPRNPLSPEMTTLKSWVLAFKTERKLIQTGIREGQSEEYRSRLLYKAKADLASIDIEEDDSFDEIIQMLEDKLTEMVAILSGRASPPLNSISLPHVLMDQDKAIFLRRAQPSEERRFLFEGGMREILFQYRDRGTALIAKERTRLLRNLRSTLDHVETVVREINSHLVVEQFLDEDQHQRIGQMLATGRELEALYQQTLESDDGIKSLLQANGFEFRTQFTVASARLCLNLYGHVSPDILKELLQLKSTDYLNRWDSNHVSSAFLEAERQRLNRDLKSALNGLAGRAQREQWPVLPVLQLFLHDQPYGRSPARPQRRAGDEGMPELVVHTTV